MNRKNEVSSSVMAALIETRDELAPYLDRLDFEALSKHNRGYLGYAQDPASKFVDAEMHNHYSIVEYYTQALARGSSVMEVGFFIPVIPIALAKLGYQVEAIEKLAFYGDSLDELVDLASSRYGIRIHDLDILNDDIQMLASRYDGVILSAILEHLNGSPKALLDRAQILGKQSALFWVSVPNAASLQKRLLMLLRGQPPFPSISDYYFSDYPFTGHNREYTLRDLTFVLEQSGFSILSLQGRNRPLRRVRSPKEYLIQLASEIGPDSVKQSLSAVVRKQQ